MIISVAMCTYRGTRFLEAQLESVLTQDRPPDELVISDDASDDETPAILEAFQTRATFPVRILRNDTRLGPTANFARTVEKCRGEIIVFSDQDDVWLSNRLACLERLLADDPDAGYAFSDACIVDENLSPLGRTLWDTVGFTPHERRRFREGDQLGVLLKHNVVQGAALAIRSSVRELVLPIPEGWMYDAWIALVLSAAGRRGLFHEEPLILYRQHSEQVLGAEKKSWNRKTIRTAKATGPAFRADGFEEVATRVAAIRYDAEAIGRLREKKSHLETRASAWRMSWRRRAAAIGVEAARGRYRRYSNGWKSICKDLLLGGTDRE